MEKQSTKELSIQLGRLTEIARDVIRINDEYIKALRQLAEDYQSFLEITSKYFTADRSNDSPAEEAEPGKKTGMDVSYVPVAGEATHLVTELPSEAAVSSEQNHQEGSLQQDTDNPDRDRDRTPAGNEGGLPKEEETADIAEGSVSVAGGLDPDASHTRNTEKTAGQPARSSVKR